MEQSEFVRNAIDVLERLGIRYMIVGSLASITYGRPRYTNDVDIVVELDEQQTRALCAAFPAPEFYVSLDAGLAAVRRGRQFNVVHPTSSNKIDFMIARRDPWARQQLERRRREELFPGVQGYLASPEDVILAKMIYYREGKSEKHPSDIAAMLQISGDKIDRQYIADWAERLGLTEIWSMILRRLTGNLPESDSSTSG